MLDLLKKNYLVNFRTVKETLKEKFRLFFYEILLTKLININLNIGNIKFSEHKRKFRVLSSDLESGNPTVNLDTHYDSFLNGIRKILTHFNMNVNRNILCYT